MTCEPYGVHLSMAAREESGLHFGVRFLHSLVYHVWGEGAWATRRCWEGGRVAHASRVHAGRVAGRLVRCGLLPLSVFHF